MTTRPLFFTTLMGLSVYSYAHVESFLDMPLSSKQDAISAYAGFFNTNTRLAKPPYLRGGR